MIICVVGPTATGKSHLANKLADYFNALIVNFDAFQLYKEMNIGTAKPSKEELNSGRYFLYDFVDVNDFYDVAKYQAICRKFLDEHKNKNIILVGGTGLYLKATLFDYKFEKEDPMPNDYLNNLTNEELFNKLLEIDKEDALKIGNNNRKRLLRALYIYETHGKNKNEINQNGKNKILYDNVYFVGLNFDREKLYEKINKRVDLMIEEGLVEEVRTLLTKYGPNTRSLAAIGYKEFTQSDDIDEIKELIKKNTRNYAKRQITFFKHQFTDIKWFETIDEAFEYGRENFK